MIYQIHLDLYTVQPLNPFRRDFRKNCGTVLTLTKALSVTSFSCPSGPPLFVWGGGGQVVLTGPESNMDSGLSD